MKFAILLKAESRFMQILENIQLRAMRIISGGMKSCPNASLYHFLDIPTLEQVRLSKGFHLLAQLWEGQIPEFLDFHESFTATADLDDHYQESPFSAVAYAEGVIYRQHGPFLTGKLAVAREHHHLFQAAFSTDVTPRVDIQRDKWKPIPVSDVPKRLFTYFSDGGYLHSLRLGALACVSPLSTWCTSFTPCSSSSHAEYEAFSWSTSLAVSELSPNSSVCFVTDSGFPRWPYQLLHQAQYTALSNIAILQSRGISVQIKWVPSHLNEDPKHDLFTAGNAEADRLATHALKNCTPEHHDVSMAFVRQAGNRHLNARPDFTNTEGFYCQYVRPQLHLAARKQLRQGDRSTGVTVFRMLSDHNLLLGHFLRIQRKSNPDSPAEECHLCRHCHEEVETLDHLLTSCSSEAVIQARSQLRSATHFDDPRNLKMLAGIMCFCDPWPAFVQFFASLDIIL
jgi:hypothetical protein